MACSINDPLWPLLVVNSLGPQKASIFVVNHDMIATLYGVSLLKPPLLDVVFIFLETPVGSSSSCKDQCESKRTIKAEEEKEPMVALVFLSMCNLLSTHLLLIQSMHICNIKQTQGSQNKRYVLHFTRGYVPGTYKRVLPLWTLVSTI